MSQVAYSEPSDTNTKSQSAFHYVLGLEQDFELTSDKSSLLKLRIDGFYKDYTNLISAFFAHSDRLAYSRKNDAIGFAKGIDIYLSLKLNNFLTWFSYSYLESEEDVLEDEFRSYPRLSAQKHTFSWITDINLGKDWSLNTKYFYGSGYPYAKKELYYEAETDEYFWRNQRLNSDYLPAYQRLDLRISKNFVFKNISLKTFLEVSNAFNYKNVRAFDYSYDENGSPQIYEITLWPILPSFGIRIQF